MGTCFRFEPLAVAKAATETVFSLSFCFLLLGRSLFQCFNLVQDLSFPVRL